MRQLIYSWWYWSRSVSLVVNGNFVSGKKSTNISFQSVWKFLFYFLLYKQLLLSNLKLTLKCKIVLFEIYQIKVFLFFFFIWVFFHEHLRITGHQGKREAISLTSLYHFHQPHGHVDNSLAIIVESSPLHIASSRSK